jgi:radical SAM superfamily enzyme YgiQ (UPF0313 family)
LVGISAMTSYVNRGYEIADTFRPRGVPVVMGGVHPSFMPQESLKHSDAVVIGEIELVIDRLLEDREAGVMRGTYPLSRNFTTSTASITGVVIARRPSRDRRASQPRWPKWPIRHTWLP